MKRRNIWAKQARASKGRNKRTSYNNESYHSAREANYAAELDLRKKAGEIKGWEKQIRFRFPPQGQPWICDYYADFKEIYHDGHEKIVEIKPKGGAVIFPIGELKIKLMRYFYPDVDYLVIR